MPITITFDIPARPDIEASTIMVEGAKGMQCKSLTKEIEDILDHRVTELTPDHCQQAIRAKQGQHHG